MASARDSAPASSYNTDEMSDKARFVHRLDLLKHRSDTDVELLEELFALADDKLAGVVDRRQFLEILCGGLQDEKESRDGLIRERRAWGKEKEEKKKRKEEEEKKAKLELAAAAKKKSALEKKDGAAAIADKVKQRNEMKRLADERMRKEKKAKTKAEWEKKERLAGQAKTTEPISAPGTLPALIVMHTTY